jgi:hypothetical protein
MKVKQISLFMENRTGRLADVARTLGEAGVNIRALSLADTSDFGILRLIVNDVSLALSVLRSTGHTAIVTDVIAVEVPDQPGGLATVLTALEKAGVNVEYMYAFVEKATDKAVLVFRFENADVALAAFKKAGISVLPAATVYSL